MKNRVPRIQPPLLGRHLRVGGEQARVDVVVGLQDGVVGIGRVKGHLAMISIHHNFDRVAHIVDVLVIQGDRFGIGVATGIGVGVLNPVELAFVDHNIRIGVQAQERSYFLNPFLN